MSEEKQENKTYKIKCWGFDEDGNLIEVMIEQESYDAKFIYTPPNNDTETDKQ